MGQTTICWDEFATYMLLEYQKKDDSYQRSKKVRYRLEKVEKARQMMLALFISPYECLSHLSV